MCNGAKESVTMLEHSCEFGGGGGGLGGGGGPTCDEKYKASGINIPPRIGILATS